ncbi:MAG: bacteriocin family protein [Actinobacteria bacterium]|nr:bacteriocin family protein [Actinomycetota bacterium]MCB9413060.1 bacteriocin family protein [Actinomycetota bacterium]
MDHLRRELAPISNLGWEQIAEEATRVLKQRLAARRLVDFHDHHDWTLSAVPTGRISEQSAGEVQLARREVTPLMEMRADFVLSRDELDAADRGAPDMDTGPVIAAAVAAARAEDLLVFTGDSVAGVVGIAEASPHPTVDLGSGVIEAVAEAVEVLRLASVAGPYALAVGADLWVGLQAGSDRGYPLMSHLKLLLDGPVVWAPSLTGALLISQRGGDFEIEAGQDWAIGYQGHDDQSVALYLQSSATVVVSTPEASVRIGGSVKS